MASDSLDLAIAKGAPTVDFSTLGNLLNDYVGGVKSKQQVDLINAFKNGLPPGADGQPDLNAMANKLYQLGDFSNASTLGNLGIQRQFQQQIPAAIKFLQTGKTDPINAPTAGGAPAPTGGPQAAAPTSYTNRVAQAESGGDPNARNPNSTATGTFQFTQPTWANVARQHPELGLTPDGITDPAQQQKAMQAFTTDNGNTLKAAGIQPTDGNLYLAHFLGAQGATHFLQGMQQNPNAPAASLVGPQAVAANRSVFFQNGQPLSAQQFYSNMTGRFSGQASQSPQGGPQSPQSTQPASVGASATSSTNPELTGLVPNGMDPNQFRTGLRTFGALMSSNPATAGLGKALTDQADKIDKALTPTNEQKNYYADRLPGESMSDYEARKGGQKTSADEYAKVTAEQYKEAGKSYQAAQATQFRLGLIDDSINKLGPDWMGTGANLKANAAKAWNSLAQTVLPDGVAPKFQIDPTKIATWEDFNKQTTNLGFELAKTLGSREAMMIVQQAVNSVPNANQTPLGAKLVSASLHQASQRQQDYYEYLSAHPGQLGADVAFNKLNPPQKYVDAAIKSVGNTQQPAQGQPGTAQAASIPFPPAAVQMLRANPALRGQFDAKYGAGASARILGGG